MKPQQNNTWADSAAVSVASLAACSSVCGTNSKGTPENMSQTLSKQPIGNNCRHNTTQKHKRQRRSSTSQVHLTAKSGAKKQLQQCQNCSLEHAMPQNRLAAKTKRLQTKEQGTARINAPLWEEIVTVKLRQVASTLQLLSAIKWPLRQCSRGKYKASCAAAAPVAVS